MLMKGMILAAGFGTRLLPLTEKKPKPLFPILGRPLIDILIRRLESAGCEAVIVNTHHLADLIDGFVRAQAYSVPVVTRYEPTILGTGGAIKNVEDFWDDEPFLVVNSDIFTNIDLVTVYRFHLNHKHPVTLVVHDYEQFNHVWIDSRDHISGFGHTAPCPPPGLESARGTPGPTDARQLAFTGIHVLDPRVLSFIPNGTFYNMIDAYCEMIRQGLGIKGFIARKHYWYDIGTMVGYRAATREALARKAFKALFHAAASDSLVWSKLKGDGSDRRWYRVILGNDSLIVADHGPRPEAEVCEADAFAAIGRHLYDKGIPVPRIFDYDRPMGLVVLEDLGDLHLQTLVRRAAHTEDVANHYRAVIDLLIAMGVEGTKRFDLSYTYQTPYYDRELILEKESRYFVEAFLNGYLGLETDFDDLEDEFQILAQRALDHPYKGLLHRDFQSRNILVKGGDYYFIDFQGARLGPLPYDLASLLIDPYVELPRSFQEDLLRYYLRRLSDSVPVDPNDFLHAYKYCAINRNLQILGAFAFLSRVKGKKEFETYIPPAVFSLKARLCAIEQGQCPKLSSIIERI
jgi:aminoglycoside/choline kinase family phosphotransferase/GTP:adenosylcobinamide-phosphate guanylyltransferase